MTTSVNPQAHAIFRRRYGNDKNVMAPHVDAYRMAGSGTLAIELAHGNGLRAGTQIWGVTVLLARDPEVRINLSESFATRGEAEAYIETLRRWREPAEEETRA